jgi:cytochrome c556
VGERRDSARAAPAAGDAGAPDHGKFAWSQIVDGDALATEVKRLAARLAEPLASPSAFKSGGYNACGADFAMLAVVFAVVHEFDGQVRWQGDSAAMRDQFARASANCRAASDESFAEASRCRQDLDDLIRGGRLGAMASANLETWSSLADRKLLMQRMERGLEEAINPQLSDERAFGRVADDIRHEAAMLALLAEVIDREQFEFWDDDTFVESAQELGAAAGELSQAAAEQDYDAARAAAGRVSQSCANCHAGYRP